MVAAAAGEIDALDGLVALAEQSLIARDLAPLGDDARLEATGIRFAMLKTVQGFALGRLIAAGRETEVRDRHAARTWRSPRRPSPT